VLQTLCIIGAYMTKKIICVYWHSPEKPFFFVWNFFWFHQCNYMSVLFNDFFIFFLFFLNVVVLSHS
jgi:hypothetical protein